MARQDALSIYTDDSQTKDKLAETYGEVIENVQKGAISEQIKNKNYSGDPTTGSVEIDRFKNAEIKDKGTARTAAKVWKKLLKRISNYMVSLVWLKKEN